jgi:hypothetical protein
MQHPPAFGYTQIAQEMMRGLLDTVSDRQDLSEKRKDSLRQTAVCTVMAYNPRDPLEVMVASQSVVYDQIVHDGARDLLRGQAELIKLRARPSILAAGKTFLAAMEMVLKLQHRPEHTLAFARPLAETQPAPAPAMAPAAAPPDPTPRPEPIAADPGPSPDQPAPDVANEASAGGAVIPEAPVPPSAAHEAASPRAAEPGDAAPAALPRRVAPARIGGQAVPGIGAQIPAARRATELGSGPAVADLPDAEIERIPPDGLDPAEQQAIRDTVARTSRAAGHAVA